MTALLTAGCVACGAATAPKTAKPHPTSTPKAPTPVPTPAPPPPPVAAPYIVQVENLNDARPQSGLSTADVIYEYETEGGISRFSAMFFETPPSGIGPVRSARLATVKLLGIWDATLLYSGASQYVSELLANGGYRQYNETTSQGALFRINSRFAPHNLYTDGSHFAAFEQLVGPHTVPYHLWNRTTGPAALPPGGTPMPKFSVPVSDSEVPSYSYDPSTGGYQRTESDTGVLTDADSGAPWEPKTILVVPVDVTTGPEIENPPNSYGLDFGLVGNTRAQLLMGGQLFTINFTQTTSGPPQLTLANGSPAPLVPGQVLIELVKTGRAISAG